MSRGELLLHVAEALPHAISAVDGTDRFAYANPAFWRNAGLDPAACPIGMSAADMVRMLAYRGLYGPGDPEARAREVLAIDRTRPQTRQSRSADGSRVLELGSFPLACGGWVSTAHDVTALQRAVEEASARSRLVETVLSRLGGGVVAYDADLRVMLANPSFEALTGQPSGAIRPGMTYREMLEAQEARGEFRNADSADQIAVRMERMRGARSVGFRERPSGEVLRFERHPLPDGGVVVEVADITALKRAEDEAQRRAALLDGVLAALPHGVVVVGPDRRMVMMNATYRQLMRDHDVQPGDRVDDVIARRIAVGEYDAETAAQVRRRNAAGAEGDAARAGPMRRVRRDGTVIEHRAGRLPDGGIVSVFTDITALHKAEEQARERAALLDAVLEALPDGVSVFGPDRRARMSNAAYRRIMGDAAVRLGESLEELGARRVADGEMTPEMRTALLNLHVGSGSEAVPPVRRVRPDGTAIVVRAGRLPDGGHIAVVSDVSALQRAEEEARRRAALLETMAGSIRHGIVMYGPDQRILATNAKAAELIGVPAERLVPGRTRQEVIDEQMAAGRMTPLQAETLRALDRSTPQRYARTQPDGRVLEVASDPTPDGGFVVTYTDVTEERAIRVELEKAREAAEAGSAAKSRFLATMSHELRTPLNAVIGFSEAIAGERNLARVAEYAASVNEAGRHLLTLIDDILDVARSQTGALAMVEEPIPLAPLLVVAHRETAPAAQAAGFTLDLSLPPRLPALRGDALRLSQVLGKLLSNAVKFTPSGGRIALSAAVEAEGLAIRVADTGIGIPPQDRERSFEPFTQLDASLSRRFQGSGLGLHIARTLTTALGGTLTLEDPAEGAGLVAVLRFPAERLVAPAAA